VKEAKEAKEAKQKKRNHKVAAYMFALFKDVRVVRLLRHYVNTMPQNILLDVLSFRQCREHSRSNLCFLLHDLMGLYFARILSFKYAGEWAANNIWLLFIDFWAVFF